MKHVRNNNRNFAQESLHDSAKSYFGDDYVKNSAIGLGIGAGVGGLANVLVGDKKKSKVRRLLEGAGLGGLIGAGAGLGYSGLKHKDAEVAARDSNIVDLMASKNILSYENEEAKKANMKLSNENKALFEKNKSIGEELKGSNQKIYELTGQIAKNAEEVARAKESNAKFDSEVEKNQKLRKELFESVMTGKDPRGAFVAGQEYSPSKHKQLKDLVASYDVEDAEQAKAAEQEAKAREALAAIPGVKATIQERKKDYQGLDMLAQGNREKLAAIESMIANVQEQYGLTREDAISALVRFQSR